MPPSQPVLLRVLERGVSDMFGKAYRRVAEKDEIGARVGDGPGVAIYPAMARLHEAGATDRAALLRMSDAVRPAMRPFTLALFRSAGWGRRRPDKRSDGRIDARQFVGHEGCLA